MTKSEAEVVYDSIKNALELYGIRIEDDDSDNQLKVNINGLRATLTIS